MMNTTGIIFGVFTVIAIGIGFVWVIKLEYYIGAQVARFVAFFGILLGLASLFIPNFYISAIIGILGGSIIWGATELPSQERRVAKGVFPANPRKNDRKKIKSDFIDNSRGKS